MKPSETWEEATAYVKEQADIVQVIGEYVNLKRSGVRYLGLCPFHQEKTPSFSVHPGQQFYYCFGCEASGDVFSFLMQYHHVSFPEALKNLAERLHIELPERRKSERERELEQRRQRLFELNRKAAEIYRRYLLEAPGAGAARSYLQQRGMGSDIGQKYELGYAPSKETAGWNFLGSRLNPDELESARDIGLLAVNERGSTYDRFRDRIIFPIFDVRGRISGFGGRILGDGGPKYLNSPESDIYSKSRLLFGFYQQREAIRSQRRAVLVEGNFDLLALVASGFAPVAAPLGTALTPEQVRQLKPLVEEIVLLFDGDEAGLKAAERATTCFLAEGVAGRVALLPEGHDPDTFVREHGAAAVERLVEAAQPLPEFAAQRSIDRHGLTLAGKTRIVEELKPLLSAAGSELQRSVAAAHFAGILGIEAEMLLAHVAAPSDRGARRPVDEPPPDGNGRAIAPLTGGLKSLMSFLVLNPVHFPLLAEAGVEELVAGTIGEIVYLQVRRSYEKNGGAFEPEQLLTGLPEGEERALVAAILLEPAPGGTDEGGDETDAETAQEVADWVHRSVLKKRSDKLMADINEAQKKNDFKEISDLMKLKMKIDGEIKAAG